MAGAAVVEVLNVDDLESRLFHDAGGIKRGIGGEPGFGDLGDGGRIREKTAFGVGEDIELELSDAAVELDVDGGVAIIERGGGAGIGFEEKGGFAGGEAEVVAVVAADELDVGDAEGGLGED